MGRINPRCNAVRPDLADVRLRGQVEAERFVSGEPACIVAPYVGLHVKPAADAGIGTQALYGEAALVFERKDDWAWIQLAGDGYTGYVPEGVLAAMTAGPAHRVRSLWAPVLPRPTIKAPARMALPLGSCLAGAVEGDMLALSGGGYVPLQLVSPLASPSDPDFVAVALQMLGVPYVWGGKTPQGADCSGLVQLSMTMAGLRAPRDSDMQEAELGDPLLAGAPLQRGDLVFWKGHVGIMVDGENLLHSNAYRMCVSVEPVAEAVARTTAAGSAVSSIRRLPRLVGERIPR